MALLSPCPACPAEPVLLRRIHWAQKRAQKIVLSWWLGFPLIWPWRLTWRTFISMLLWHLRTRSGRSDTRTYVRESWGLVAPLPRWLLLGHSRVGSKGSVRSLWTEMDHKTRCGEYSLWSRRISEHWLLLRAGSTPVPGLKGGVTLNPLSTVTSVICGLRTCVRMYVWLSESHVQFLQTLRASYSANDFKCIISFSFHRNCEMGILHPYFSDKKLKSWEVTWFVRLQVRFAKYWSQESNPGLRHSGDRRTLGTYCVESPGQTPEMHRKLSCLHVKKGDTLSSSEC